jgi:hypothetical protein
MYDANIQPPPPQRPARQWPPFMGMLSILTVAFPVIIFCAYCMIVYYWVSQPGFEPELMPETEIMNLGLGTLAMLCGVITVSAVGIAVGLGALFGRTANKVLGLIGVLMNGFLLLSLICGFLFFMLA